MKTGIPARVDQERAQSRKPAYTEFAPLVRKYTEQAGHFPGDAGELVAGARTAIRNVDAHVHGAIGQAVREAADPRTPRAGKQEIINGLADDVRGHAEEQLRIAANRLDVAEATLIHQALPKIGNNDRLTARSDAAMMLANVEPAGLYDAMRQLAERGDSLGALAASEWGQQYLTARGVGKADELHRGIVAAAVEAAKSGPDPDRAAAADAIGRLADLRGAITAAGLMASHAAGDDMPYLKAAGGTLSQDSE